MTKVEKYAIKDQLERLFEQIAYRRDAGFFCRILFFPLYLLSILYGAVVRIRLALYSSGLLNVREIGCKVISVGNITVGGTGKTPTVEFVARSLRERGISVAILSRGYRRAGKGIDVVSDGHQLLLGAEEAGDEPYMLARRLRNVPVIVGADRYEAGRFALDRFSPDVIILDDGFQHIRLKRDLDILLVDGEKVFGNRNLLPRGPLREPLSAMKRAETFLITKAYSDINRITQDIMDRQPEAVVFKSSYRPEKFISIIDGSKKDLSFISGHRVFALSAIANPSSFVSLLSSLGCSLASEANYADHYSYSAKDLEEIEKKATAAAAELIITTEKDAVKLERFKNMMRMPIYYLEIGLDMRGNEQKFIDVVIAKIHC